MRSNPTRRSEIARDGEPAGEGGVIASAQDPGEAPARRADGPEPTLRGGSEGVARLAGRLKKVEAQRREAGAGLEHVRSGIDSVAEGIERLLERLDARGSDRTLPPEGSATGASKAAEPKLGEVLRQAIERANHRLGGLASELRQATLSRDLASAQLAHVQARASRLQSEKAALEQQAAELARENALLRTQTRAASAQVTTLAHETGRRLDDRAWSVGLFLSRCPGLAAYGESVGHDLSRLFAFALLSEVEADGGLSDDVKEQARAIVDLFDPVFYLSQYHDVSLAGLNPLLHYVTTGWREARRPNLLFDPDYYRAEAGAPTGDPLHHYATAGFLDGRKPHPLFDGGFYWRQYPDVAAAKTNPLFHYQVWGGREGRRPSPLFDPAYFLESYDSPVACDNPLHAYLQQAGDWRAEPHPLFSTPYFARRAGIEAFAEPPLLVYLERRDLWGSASPHPLFDPAYLLAQPAARERPVEEGMSPLEYFCRLSETADVDPHPLFDSRLYRYQVEVEQQRELMQPPIIDYLTRGWRDKSLLPNLLFDPQTYCARNPAEITGPELVHYCLEGDRAGFWCHPMFCAGIYNHAREDRGSETALAHYLRSAPEAGRISHPHLDRPLDHRLIDWVRSAIALREEVDPDFYRAAYPDLTGLSDAEAVAHFNEQGKQEGRYGAPRQLLEALGLRIRDIPIGFFAEDYVHYNPDLATLGDDFRTRFRHYLENGHRENRKIGHWQFHLNAMPLPDLPAPGRRIAIDSDRQRIDVCLLIHVFYADLWRELAGFAQNLDVVSRDVFVNVVDAAWTPRLQRDIRELCPGAFVQLSNDNGRDIGGFMRLLDNVDFDRYELFALMHTKKSPHVAPEHGVHWRRALLSAFAGSREIVEECVGLFREDATVGLIGCADCRDTTLGNNEAAFNTLLDRFAIEAQHRDPDYLSGTMFMIRPQIVKRLYDELRQTEWEYGGDKDVEFHRDGQIAHGVERLIGSLVRQMGYRIVWRPTGDER